MKAKLTVLREKYPVVISFILSALWIGIMLLSAFALQNIPFIAQSKNEYLGQLLVDLIGTVLGIILLFLFCYQTVFKEKKYGFGKGILTGLYFVVIGLIAIIANLFLSFFNSLTAGTEVILSFKPIGYIIIFTLTMFLIGDRKSVV